MNFILNPIGKIYKKNSVYCFIKEDFFDALKFLDKFSHLILFTYPNENKKYVCLKKTDIQDFFDDNLIYCQVCRIIGINEKKGLIELDNCFADDSDFIIDIKPYFPIEDRIRIEDVSVFQKDNSYKDFVSKYNNFKNQKLPENENIYSEWRMDFEKKSMIKNFDDKLLNHEISFNEKIEISQIGSIYNESGKTLLKFNEEFNKKIELLKNFSHIKVLWWFSRFDEEKYRKAVQCNPPYEKAPRTGIFASRSPVRPNPIALTTARIKKINFDTMTAEITEIDAFDKTPVISIKPYIPCYDRVRHFEVPEWLNHWSEWNYENKKNEINIEEFKNSESDFEKLKNEFFPKIIGTEEKKLDSVNKSEEKHTDNEIVISGCRHHNLKNISLKIPKNKLIVVTGVSGSGKSSLVFDTIYAESQRRFIDSLSTTGRQSFEQFEKPDVDKISGLPPAIAVEQKSINRNPRSTVGTMTEIYDYLRLLYSRIGIRHCPDCGSAVQPKSEYEIINLLFELSIKNKITICYAENDEKIDDIVIGADDAGREFKTKLKEIVRNALIKGRGALGIIVNGKKYILHTRNKCYHCGRIFFDLTSSYFSYNNHEGMCKKCKGLGYTLTVLPELVVSNPEISLLDGASVWYGNLRQQIQNPTGNWWKGEVIALAELMNVNLELPWKDLPAEFKNKALYGSDGEKVIFKYSSARGRKGEITRPVFGAVNNIERMFRDTQGEASRKFYMQFMQNEICSDCRGERLNIEGRLVTVAEIRYPQAAQMSIRNLMNWTAGLQENLEQEHYKISEDIIAELFRRLKQLCEIGVNYLTLDRTAPTLSGGEAQRIRLASQLNCGLTDLLYVLDEPSIGLHPSDHHLLINTMKNIRDSGNSVLVVEHDIETMKEADWLIEIGPEAGENGGHIVEYGTPAHIIQNKNSVTGKYLSGLLTVKSSVSRNFNNEQKYLKLYNCRLNNLKNINVFFPLGKFICVTGVSGCGKSSLVSKTLAPALDAYFFGGYKYNTDIDKIEGQEHIDKIITVTQAPIGRTPRSNPATYIELFDLIRKEFSKTEDAIKMKLPENYFSFNSKGGRCEACQGGGRKNIEMHFMNDIWIECPECRGKRFNTEILEVKYRGNTIADVLEMDAHQAMNLFKGNRKIEKILKVVIEVGLGYLKLGQNSVTLSGGEAQRIKLAKELCKNDTGKTLYLLDEPTTGLHSADIQKLLDLLIKLTQKGNTVIVIEHNIDLIKNAEWVIDLGPGSGDDGGKIVEQGTPEKIRKCRESKTGQYL